MSALDKGAPATAAIAPDPTQQVVVLEDAATEKDRVAEAAGEDENGDIPTKKKPEAGLNNYFVSTLP